MKLLYLLLAIFVSAVSSQTCPLRCQCYNNQTADCSSKRLFSIQPKSFQNFGNLVVLRLEDNRINTLDTDIFSPLTNLKRLDLDQNALTTLPETLFSSLLELQVLYLNGNTIVTLPSRIFNSLIKLTVLWLHDNKIQSMPSEIFSPLENLKTLSLKNNKINILDNKWFKNLKNLEFLALAGNQIEALQENAFTGLGNLKNLSLNGNQISSIQDETFNETPKLEFLWLYDNNIERVTDNTFYGLSFLRSVSLHNNKIRTVSKNAFRSLVNLEQLYLDGNMLVTLDTTLLLSQRKLRMFELQDNKLTTVEVALLNPLINLRTFNLSGNPLVCDCTLRETWQWWTTNILDPQATCIQPGANKISKARDQLMNLACTSSGVTEAQVQMNMTPAPFKQGSNCDARKLAAGCIVLLVIIVGMMVGFFVYLKYYNKPKPGHEFLVAMEALSVYKTGGYLKPLAQWNSCGISEPDMATYKVMHYLARFGYLHPKSRRADALVSKQALRKAITEFQEFAGLNVTGTLTPETTYLMSLPRCGVMDTWKYKDLKENKRRKKRYALQGSWWTMNTISYRIFRYPRNLESQTVDKEIAKAFKMWSDNTNYTFVPKYAGKVHIAIRFERGDHDDTDTFDGPGGSLAHAFFPVFGGDTHFDDDETWTVDSNKGVNLYQVATHEFGHSLGLNHSKEKSAVMAPFYHGYNPNFKLDKDDIEGIQAVLTAKSSDNPNKSSKKCD